MITKIKPLKKIVELVKAYRAEGRTIITTNGCFDILHVGHIRELQESKRQARSSNGSVLIVGIDSDEAIKRRNKGPGRPINNQYDRAEVVAALVCVDLVTIYDFDDCRPFIEAVKPDIHTNGPEYGKPEEWIEYETIIKCGAKPYTYTRHKDAKGEDYSTTNLIKRIKGE